MFIYVCDTGHDGSFVQVTRYSRCMYAYVYNILVRNAEVINVLSPSIGTYTGSGKGFFGVDVHLHLVVVFPSFPGRV